MFEYRVPRARLYWSGSALIQAAETEERVLAHKRNAPYGSWISPITSDMIVSGQIDLNPIISRVSDLPHWQECFEKMEHGEYVKAVLTT